MVRIVEGGFLKGNSHTFRLDGKLAVVTGAASGIGRAVAQRFAASGACVRLLDIDEKAADAVASEIRATGGNAKAYGCDVSQPSAVNATFNKILEDGDLHILINNAGISHVGNLESTTEEDFDKVFSVNVKGIYNCMCASVAHMKANGGGIIVNMASIAGTSGLADRFAYSMSKGAVVAMTYSVAKDYLGHKIVFLRPESTRLSWMDSCTAIIPARSRRCLRSWKSHSPSAEWPNPKRSPPLLSFFVPMKPRSSQDPITLSTGVS
jgi:NAD(P)-dependent dehydrogenase (short-subunit alcohol dehydrogenase family)